jgi:hypothetical protein
MVLCHQHHVGYAGIHHTDHPTWIAQRYLKDGYVLVAKPGEEQADLARDSTVCVTMIWLTL